jgi:histidine triad (HIT) family protein
MSFEECVLCRLVNGRLESSRVHEDERTVAIMDYQPVNPGHVLVVPRRHAELLEDLDPLDGVAVWSVAHRIARALRRTDLQCEGVNLLLADGEAAFQEIPHVHLHVFPRYRGDAFTISADWRPRERSELDAAAEQVREGLSHL